MFKLKITNILKLKIEINLLTIFKSQDKTFWFLIDDNTCFQILHAISRMIRMIHNY